MSALTAGRKVVTRKPNPYDHGIEVSYTVAASTTIFEGSFVRIDAGGDIVPCDGTDSQTLFFVGLALETVNNSGGADGDLSCKVLVGGIIETTIGSETLADIGKYVYTTDDQTLAVNSADNELVGTVIGMSNEGTSSFLVKLEWPGMTDAARLTS